MVADRPQTDDLAVGSAHLRPPQRHPGGERGVEFLDRGEGPSGQDVVADDQHLPLDPALARGPVGGQYVGAEVVVLGEGDGFRMEGDGFIWCDVSADHCFGAVVEIDIGTPPKCANAWRWLSKKVARSWLVVKQQNGSRELDKVMWNE